jgi:hypothetical protein
MHKRARHWSIWLQGAVLLSILAGATLWIASTEKTPPGQEDLKITVAELRSQAAVGQILAEQAAAKNLTYTYLHTQTSELQEKVGSAIEELDSLKAGSGLEEKASKARGLANALSYDLLSLSNAYQNQQDVSALKGDFADLLAQLIELENGLKPQQ